MSIEQSSPVPTKQRAPFKPHNKFSPQDDEILKCLVAQYGESSWIRIAEHMEGRNSRQCRERWLNYLSPALNKSDFTPEEDALLNQKVEELGQKWVQISKFFTGRTDQMVKNRYFLLKRKNEREMRKKQKKMNQEQKKQAPIPVDNKDIFDFVDDGYSNMVFLDKFENLLDFANDDILTLNNDFFF